MVASTFSLEYGGQVAYMKETLGSYEILEPYFNQPQKEITDISSA